MHIFKALTTLAALAGSVFAQELDFPGLEEVSKGPKPQVSAELVSDTAEIAPGTAFTVAVKFEHKPKWHTYWTNTGSIQLPPEITWTLPKGFTAAKPEFGVPEIKQDGAETRYVFGGTSYILVKITSPATLPTTGSSEIAFSGRYQFCEDGGSCKMSKPQDNPKLTLPHAAAAKPNAEVSAELQAYKAKHFAKPLTQFTAKAYQLATGYAVYFTGTGEVPAAAQFLVSKAKIADAATPAVISPGPNGFLISLKAHEEMDAENKPTQIDGVLVIGDEKFAVQAPIVAGEPPVAAPASSGGQGGKSLGFILWSAFLGGLILNLMPCVFPVIGLKIMDFVKQSGEDSFKVKLHGMSFSFGILVTFMALALATILLKGSWGFQLQNPWVVYVILFIMFVFGMNMYGVFEIGTGAMGVGDRKSVV